MLHKDAAELVGPGVVAVEALETHVTSGRRVFAGGLVAQTGVSARSAAPPAIAKGKKRMADKSSVDGEVNQIRREEERIKEARAYFDICIMLEVLQEPSQV